MAAQAESLHQAAADVLRRSCKGEGTRQVLYAVNLPPVFCAEVVFGFFAFCIAVNVIFAKLCSDSS
jgi:hypothetical protein